MKLTTVLLVLSASLSASAQNAAPAQPAATPARDWKLSVGAGAVVKSSAYKGLHDPEFTAIPVIQASYDRFFVTGLEGGAMLYQDDKLEFSVRGRWNFEGYDAGESSALTGMADRDGTMEAGLSAEYDFGFLKTSLTFWQDLLGEHDGQQGIWTIKRTYVPAERFYLTPFASLVWESKNYADHYYGVRAVEAVAGRPAYNPGSSFNYRAGLDLVHVIDKQWSVRVAGYAEFLDSDIRNSPIVDRAYGVGAFSGVTYSF